MEKVNCLQKMKLSNERNIKLLSFLLPVLVLVLVVTASAASDEEQHHRRLRHYHPGAVLRQDNDADRTASSYLPKAVCDLPGAQAGTCKGRFLRWYYNATVEQCQTFFWGGCEGNANRFPTVEMCRDLCVDETTNSIEKGQPCCRAQEKPLCAKDGIPVCCPTDAKWVCPANINNNINNDNGAPEYRCRGEIIKDGTPWGSVCDEPTADDKEEMCSLDMDAGPCKGQQPRWYYNPVLQECVEFVYGGCFGNANNFGRRVDCEAACGANAPNVCAEENRPKCIADGGLATCLPPNGPWECPTQEEAEDLKSTTTTTTITTVTPTTTTTATTTVTTSQLDTPEAPDTPAQDDNQVLDGPVEEQVNAMFGENCLCWAPSSTLMVVDSREFGRETTTTCTTMTLQQVHRDSSSSHIMVQAQHGYEKLYGWGHVVSTQQSTNMLQIATTLAMDNGKTSDRHVNAWPTINMQVLLVATTSILIILRFMASFRKHHTSCNVFFWKRT